MIKGVCLGKEIVVTVVNKIGVLADMSKILSEKGINIEAAAGYAQEKDAKIMLITDDNVRAIEALKKSHYTLIEENDVIMVDLENKPGVLKQVTEKLASENIDIKYIYGAACSSGCPSRIVLSTNDNQKALVLFKK